MPGWQSGLIQRKSRMASWSLYAAGSRPVVSNGTLGRKSAADFLIFGFLTTFESLRFESQLFSYRRLMLLCNNIVNKQNLKMPGWQSGLIQRKSRMASWSLYAAGSRPVVSNGTLGFESQPRRFCCICL